MSVQLQGLEISFSESSPQVRGVEVEFDYLSGLAPNGPLFTASCAVSGIDRDFTLDDTGSFLDTGTIGLSGADQAVFDDNNGYWGPVATERVSGIETVDFSAKDAIVFETVSTFETTGLTASETLDRPASDTATFTDTADAPGTVYDSGSGDDFAQSGGLATETPSFVESTDLTASETLDRPGSDTITGIESITTTATLSAADTGSGVDVGTIGLSGSEHGTFVDAPTLTVVLSGIETLTADEVVDFPYKDLNADESGSGNELAYLSYAELFLNETGSGSEFVQIYLSTTEVASGAETTLVGQDNVATDTISGSESASLLQGYSAADNANGSEVGSITIPAADTGTGSEATSVVIQVSAQEFAHAQDLLCLELSGSIGPKVPRIGPEIYLPSWVRAHTDTTLSPASGNLLFNFFQHWAEGFVPFRAGLHHGRDNRWLITASVGARRIEWSVSNKIGDLPKSISFTTSTITRVISGVVRQSTSPFDFDTSVDPVFYLDPISRRLRLRNLHVKQATKTSSNGLYSICGESDGAVPDSGVYWRRHPDQSWEWIDPESPAYRADNGPSFTVPFTGTILIAWGSQSLLTNLLSGTVRMEYAGGNTIDLPLSRIDLSNLFDGYGDFLGLPRLLREDNLAYKRRLLTETEIPYDESETGASRAIAARLGLVQSIRWDGISELSLDPGDVSGITAIKIANVDRIRSVQESLLPIDATRRIYHATYPNWRHGWLLFVDGVPEPGVSLSGSVITLSRSTSGSVLAQYAIDQYQIQYSSSGTIRALLPGVGLPSGGYQVLLARGVAVHSTDRESFRNERLIDQRGLPNQLFLDLSSNLLRDSSILFGRSRWSSANWLNETDRTPASIHLQVPMDLDSFPLSGSL